MTRRTIPWHRLLPRHHRLLVWWALAGLGIALPWLIGGSGLPWLTPRTADSAGCQVASIYDGDTLRATCSGIKLKIRLYCIDTPEMQQKPWGSESRDYLRRLTPRVVSLKIHDTDRYGRKVAEVIDPPPAACSTAPWSKPVRPLCIGATALIRAIARRRPAPRLQGSASGPGQAITSGLGIGASARLCAGATRVASRSAAERRAPSLSAFGSPTLTKVMVLRVKSAKALADDYSSQS